MESTVQEGATRASSANCVASLVWKSADTRAVILPPPNSVAVALRTCKGGRRWASTSSTVASGRKYSNCADSPASAADSGPAPDCRQLTGVSRWINSGAGTRSVAAPSCQKMPSG